jgi:nucleotide-binding universal stress UspA family protein
MFPYERPLLATEHTEFDVGAERVAFEVAGRYALPLAACVPIVSNPELESAVPQAVARLEADVARRLIALRDDAARAKIGFAADVRRGEEAWRSIVDEAHSLGADLLIVRRRGKRSFLAHLMIGEMVGKVASEAPCSVLMVPRAAALWTQRIVAAVDGSAATSAIARTAAQMAAAARLPLVVVSVAASDTPADRSAAEGIVASAVRLARKEGVIAEGRVTAGRAADGVADVACSRSRTRSAAARRCRSRGLVQTIPGRKRRVRARYAA